jgi:hypothetical protein
MRHTALSVITAIALIFSTFALAGPAEAASAKVKIKNAKSVSVGWSGRATVKPKFTKSKGVKIKKRTITIRKNGKVIAAKKATVALDPGKYRARVIVTYRAKGKTKTVAKSFKLHVKRGACATSKDFADVQAAQTGAGDSKSVVASKLRSAGTPAPVAMPDMTNIMGGSNGGGMDPNSLLVLLGIAEVLNYPACGTPKRPVTVTFLKDKDQAISKDRK